MNLKKRMTSFLVFLFALGTSFTGNAQVFPWNNFTVSESITDDCCILLTINFTYDGHAPFGNENSVVWISEWIGGEYHTVSLESVGTTGTYTYKLCPSEGQLMLDYRIRLAEDPLDLRPAFLYSEWNAAAIGLLQHTSIGDLSDCCLDCYGSPNIGEYLDLTVEKNSDNCEPGECYVSGALNLPPNLTCFDSYIYYFADDINETPQPLVDGYVVQLDADNGGGYCISPGGSVLFGMGLKKGDHEGEFCFIEQYVGCTYTCCDEYELTVTEVSSVGTGFDCCYSYVLSGDNVASNCVADKVIVQDINDPVYFTYFGPGDAFSGTICGNSEFCPDGQSGVCNVSRRFVLYNAAGEYLCHREWSSDNSCGNGSGGGGGGTPSGAAPQSNGELGLATGTYDFNMYNVPNPASEFTTIHFTTDAEMIVRLDLFDLSGRSMGMINEGTYREGQQSINLNTSNYASGTYIVLLSANGKTAAHRIQIE